MTRGISCSCKFVEAAELGKPSRLKLGLFGLVGFAAASQKRADDKMQSRRQTLLEHGQQRRRFFITVSGYFMHTRSRSVRTGSAPSIIFINGKAPRRYIVDYLDIGMRIATKGRFEDYLRHLVQCFCGLLD